MPESLPPAPNDLTVVDRTLSNQEFLLRYAQPGCVGLCAGSTLADRVILTAERHLDKEGRPGRWSHAFFFQGRRADGQHWVIESDLQFERKHIRLGVQENRLAKYFDEGMYSELAVLDFSLAPAQVESLICEGLDLVASRARYSLRELVGTYLALRDPARRPRENVLARDASFFCSAFVLHLFRKIQLDLNPGLDVKHATPEDLSRTAVPHRTFLRLRPGPPHPVVELVRKVGRLRKRLRQGPGKAAE
jgi:hypothetical protein